MAYLLEPINRPYDPMLPTPLGFVANPRIFMGTKELKRQFKPVPRDLVHKAVDVDGGSRMPDFFSLAAGHYYVSSRFRAVVEKHAKDVVEYIEVQFNMPANKHPADAYYFINVLGRGQLIDWESSNKRGPTKGIENKRFYDLLWPPDQWAMKTPPLEHPAIWHEVHRAIDDFVYIGSGTNVLVTNELGDALNATFPGQVQLYSIRELQSTT